jgi:hypothetical protein
MTTATCNKRRIAMGKADVTIHVDETIDHDRRAAIAESVRKRKGVVDVLRHDKKPHLMIVQYDPDEVNSAALLAIVRQSGVHAELVGL